MASRTTYACRRCDYRTGKWLGRCPGCGEWESLEEEKITVDVKGDDEEDLDKGSFIDIEDKPKDKDQMELDNFGIDGEDATGRNMAMQTYGKVEKNILD